MACDREIVEHSCWRHWFPFQHGLWFWKNYLPFPHFHFFITWLQKNTSNMETSVINKWALHLNSSMWTWIWPCEESVVIQQPIMLLYPNLVQPSLHESLFMKFAYTFIWRHLAVKSKLHKAYTSPCSLSCMQKAVVSQQHIQGPTHLATW